MMADFTSMMGQHHPSSADATLRDAQRKIAELTAEVHRLKDERADMRQRLDAQRNLTSTAQEKLYALGQRHTQALAWVERYRSALEAVAHLMKPGREIVSERRDVYDYVVKALDVG